MFAPYCASKFAIEGLTKTLAQELPQGVTVVALDPGGINTDMLKKAYQDEASNYPTAQQRAKALVAWVFKIPASATGQHLVLPD